MTTALERLTACVDELRNGGSSVDQQTYQRRLLKELFAVKRLWYPEAVLPTTYEPVAPKKKRHSGTNAQLFHVLVQALIVYSGNHTGSAGNGAVSGAMALSSSSSSSHNTTSECVQQLICDLLVRAFDFAAVPVINETLAAKHSSIYVKTSLVIVISRLPLPDALPLVHEAIGFANKNVKAADYCMKPCLVESVTRMLDHETLPRLATFHGDAIKIVNRCYQDKAPEVRIAAAALLHVVATKTGVATSSSSSGGSSSATSGSSGNAGGGVSAGSVGAINGNSTGISGNGVSLETILHIASKGMDDVSPEARRAFSVVVGIVLAKLATCSSEGDMQAGEAGSNAGHANKSNHDEEEGARHSIDQESGSVGSGSSGSSKSKLAFKLPNMHVPGMSLSSSLSRKKAAAVNFSTIASVILYLKDTLVARYLSSGNPTQSHGGILSSLSIALCSMFERLPPDSIAENQLHEVLDAILVILDHPFALGDLTRARNSVCFVLRYGINVCLTERQQEALVGAYLQKIKDEAALAECNHHKLLSLLVELSHMFQSIGEACVSHANDASTILQGLLSYEKQSVRFQASVALASLVAALPYRLKSVLLASMQGLRNTAELLLQSGRDSDVGMNPNALDDAQLSGADDKAYLYTVQGKAAAIAHILRAIRIQNQTGLSHIYLTEILQLAQQLVESQFLEGCADSIWLTCTRAGWTLVGSLVSINDEHWIQSNLQILLDLWLKSSILHNRESSLELLRIEAAVTAMHGFLRYYKELAAKSDSVYMLAGHMLHVYLTATQDQLGNPLKRRGQVARYRLITWIIKCFVLLPPNYSDSYIVLLDLIAEYTTAQSLTSLRQSALVPANTTFLYNALSGADNPLEMVSISRLIAGDNPSALYSRELNHVLALQQNENALTDTEVEVQYLDNYWGVICEMEGTTDFADRGICSSFTYVNLVDTCVFLFGRIFHFVPEELQLRCLQHYAGVLADGRIDCEVNVCSLLFSAIHDAKRIRDAASPSLLTTTWSQQMQVMLCEMISSDNPKVRRGAGEALGMLASLICEESCKSLVHDIEKRLTPEKQSFSSPFGSSSDNNSSVLFAGAAFALASIKRACGSRISIDTGLIFRFAGEISQPLRTWILHSWSIIVESVNSTGGDYEQYIKSTSSLIDAHLLAGFKYSKTNKKALRWQSSAKIAIGRIINGVVATLGPDLSGSSRRLNEFYTIWDILRQDGDPRVEFEYLKFLEQVVVFAPAKFRNTNLLYILGVLSDAFLPPEGSLAVPQSSPSWSSAASSSSSEVVGALSEQHTRNVVVGLYGLGRTILQQVGMSCIRTLVERDPTLVRRHNLQCLLFSALHMEYNSFTWRYLPGVHGLWDFLSFKYFVPSKTRSGIDEIRNTITALIDIDGGSRENAQPCIWALFYRSIAIGESGNALIGSSDPGQLMVSPKGMDNSFGSFMSSTGNNAEDVSTNSRQTSVIESKNDSDTIASAAIAAQLDTWRATKKYVGDLIAFMPPLSRQVRQFAIECVLRVFDLISSGVTGDNGSHFDLGQTRRYYIQKITEERKRAAALQLSLDGAESLATSQLCNDDFLCMYLDEFVTLACQATTTSAEGSELQMFQCTGLRLLNVLVDKFANARDPEVLTADAYVLEPYQAQISSAVRHALKQAQVSPSTTDEEERDFYAPLLIEAHASCGNAINARLVQDKVALNRILKMVIVEDYGHMHFVGDEMTRITLSLANLSSLAKMLVASINLAIEKDGNDQRIVVASPMVKAMINGLSTTFEYVIKCWMDVNYGYGILMHGLGQWPALKHSAESRSITCGTLKIVLPIPDPENHHTSSYLEKLRATYKHYWPSIANALVYGQKYLPAIISSVPGTSNLFSLLLAFAVFHINTGVRDRIYEELVPVLRAMPLLLLNLREDTSSFAPRFQSVLNCLITASIRSSGSIRMEALNALFSSLTSENIAGALSTNANNEQQKEAFGILIGQAALCPTEVLVQLCDPNKRLNIQQVSEVLRLAIQGIVLLHTTEVARQYIVNAMGLVEQCYRPLQIRPDVYDALVALSRATIESTVAFAKAPSGADPVVIDRIQAAVHSSLMLLSQWLSEELVVAREKRTVDGLDLVLRLTTNYAVAFPDYLANDVASFHTTIAKKSAEILDVVHNDGDEKNPALTAHLLRGLHGVAKKLLDSNDHMNAKRYFALLGPGLVQILDTGRGADTEATIDVDELQEAEQMLRLLTTQLDEVYGTMFVRLVLPKLAAVLTAHGTSNSVVAGIVGRLLLSFAQTRAGAFKEVVAAMAPSSRSALEITLRSALTGGTSATAASSVGTSDGMGGKLDLSRYR